MNSTINFIDLKSQYETLKTLIDARIHAVLDHGQYIMGPEVQQLEEKLEVYTSARHCITVASGTEALLISLMALGVKPGDEVVTTPFTFAATAEVIALLSARPVFVDIQLDDCNIDAASLVRAISPRTKAILPVSLYGQVADMDEINAIAKEYGLAVIEDAAQSFGATYRGQKSCNLSMFGCTSFFPSKPLGCYGDGGAIFTNDEDLAQACREIRVHGQSKRYTHTRVGVGGRMDTLQCAVVLAKLERFEWEIARRIELGERYTKLIMEHSPFTTDQIIPLSVSSDRTCVWAQYTVRVANREHVQEKLNAQGIPSAVHYPIPLNRQAAYAHFSSESMPNAERASAEVLSLPMSPYLTDAQQERIVEVLCTL